MGYTVLTELGFASTKDVTMIDTTWVPLELRSLPENPEAVPTENLAWTLRGIADAVENDGGVRDELVVEALRESLRDLEVVHAYVKEARK